MQHPQHMWIGLEALEDQSYATEKGMKLLPLKQKRFKCNLVSILVGRR